MSERETASERHRPTTSHNYLPLVDLMVEEMRRRGMVGSGSHHDVNVEHDEWCDALNQRGYCNCHPRLTLVAPSAGGPNDN